MLRTCEWSWAESGKEYADDDKEEILDEEGDSIRTDHEEHDLKDRGEDDTGSDIDRELSWWLFFDEQQVLLYIAETSQKNSDCVAHSLLKSAISISSW